MSQAVKRVHKRKVRARRSDSSLGSSSPAEFVNRELSWLEFNRRVLNEAFNPSTPLLERVRFLSIFNSNLDEFFMKRVGGIKQQISAGISHTTPDGMTPHKELAAIRQVLGPLLKLQAEVYETELKPGLAQKGVHLLNWRTLSDLERAWVGNYYTTQVFPILTPLSVDPGHPFPYLSNLSTSLGISLCYPDKPDEKFFARVKIPAILPQWIRILEDSDEKQVRMVALDDVILHNLPDLFPGMVLLNVMPFRITRNAEVELDELDADDLLELIESELRERRFARVVRLEHGPNPDPWILTILKEELAITDEDIYELPARLDYTDLKSVHELNISQLKYEPWVPAPVPLISDNDSNIFRAISRSDFLLHHPYESFGSTVEKLIRSSVDDPKVVAIKMTLYRTGENSSIVPLLLKAAEAGKQVVCVIELKAHFDEARNIAWAQAMEKSGVHVIYGLVGLKTHAKTILVIRQERDEMRCYAHIGTGNYHSQTANIYTDMGLLTCNEFITAELIELFNFLTGRSLKRDYKHLLVAPFNIKTRLLELIAREAAASAAGKPGRIIAKMNSLEDHGIIKALYAASQAGVEIDLIVRGLCCLRPGVRGLSERIRVRSVIGRLLEHSRIFYFANGAENTLDGDFFIGSADWMYRNLLNRVEIVTPIYERDLKEKCYETLSMMLRDSVQSWMMSSNGTYFKDRGTENQQGAGLGTHAQLFKLAKERAASYAQRLDDKTKPFDLGSSHQD